jgi:hypothetical protein
MDLAGARPRWGVPVTGPGRISSTWPPSPTTRWSSCGRRRDPAPRATWADLWEALLLHARSGRAGIALARRALHTRTGKRVPDTEFARLFLRLVEAAGLPEPVSELDVTVAGHRYRIDCAYPGRAGRRRARRQGSP